jgi:hypothetical protein
LLKAFNGAIMAPNRRNLANVGSGQEGQYEEKTD